MIDLIDLYTVVVLALTGFFLGYGAFFVSILWLEASRHTGCQHILVSKYGAVFAPTDPKHDDPDVIPLPEGFWVGRLDQRLGEFTNAMWAKFWKRHEKQHARGTKSVCDPDFDWEHDLDLEELEAHLKEELREWLEDGADRVDESVDVANMMFLAWMAEQVREARKARRSQDGQD